MFIIISLVQLVSLARGGYPRSPRFQSHRLNPIDNLIQAVHNDASVQHRSIGEIRLGRTKIRELCDKSFGTIDFLDEFWLLLRPYSVWT